MGGSTSNRRTAPDERHVYSSEVELAHGTHPALVNTVADCPVSQLSNPAPETSLSGSA